jgi:hypothetical protein
VATEALAAVYTYGISIDKFRSLLGSIIAFNAVFRYIVEETARQTAQSEQRSGGLRDARTPHL